MRIHKTKNKGDLGILKVQLDLYDKGYVTFTTTSEHLPFDLIAYKAGGEFLRVQVKYRAAKNDTIFVKFATNWTDKNKTHLHLIDKSEIDIFAIYCPDTDECYYVNPKLFGNSVNIRLKPTKHNMIKNITMSHELKEIR